MPLNPGPLLVLLVFAVAFPLVTAYYTRQTLAMSVAQLVLAFLGLAILPPPVNGYAAAVFAIAAPAYFWLIEYRWHPVGPSGGR